MRRSRALPTADGRSGRPALARRLASATIAFPLSLAVVAAGTLSAVDDVAAQAPGYQQLNPGAIRAEYTAEVLDRINELLADWGTSWSNDRVDDLAELYWEEALLIPPDGPEIRGRERIHAYFEGVLFEHGHIEAFMLDFDASGGMAQVFGNYVLSIQQGDEAGTQKTGPMITVYVRRGRRWRIRSQIFIPR